ncbi:Tc5 transposase DNA-binding domain [Popillia japonica]|uniref:Tc5 transposase DNA-binding domain n=1 Tax=Popillia japonica TaxID=7064 RepID=A0AAW1MWA8_POPJA
MKQAIHEILSNRMSQREASRCFDIKRGTLLSRLKKLRTKYSAEQLMQVYRDDSGNECDNNEDAAYSSKYTVAQVFSTKQEEELVKYIKMCSDMNYGLTYKQIRMLAHEYACIFPECKIPARWQQNKIAGLDWLKSFMNRNKTEISLRKPENTSLARATGFNKRSVSEFFDNYVSVISKHQNINFTRNKFTISTKQGLAFTDDDFIGSYADITTGDTVEEAASDIPQEVPMMADEGTLVSLGSVKQCGNKTIPTPDLIRPFPRPCIKRKKDGVNRKGKSRIYTDTPEKNRLEQLEYERGARKKNLEEKKIQKVMNKLFPKNNEKTKRIPQRKRKMSESSSDSNHTVVLESDEYSDDSEGDAVPTLRNDDVINDNDFLLFVILYES